MKKKFKSSKSLDYNNNPLDRLVCIQIKPIKLMALIDIIRANEKYFQEKKQKNRNRIWLRNFRLLTLNHIKLERSD